MYLLMEYKSYIKITKSERKFKKLKNFNIYKRKLPNKFKI